MHATLARCALVLSTTTLFAVSAHAANLNPTLLTQSEFRLLTEDLGSALSYKPLIPAEAMGITGFDIGIAVTGTALENRAVWQKASPGSDVPSTLPIPTIRVHKGLPFDIDIGAMYGKVDNIQVAGGELRWAILPGSTAVPAFAVRASYTALSGVDRLKLNTMGLDVSLSKGFAFLTPYVGAGVVKVKGTPDGGGLSSESLSQGKVFAGLNLNFGLVNLVFEGDRTGKATSYGAKLGFRF
ncbi:MAG: hypothetical protein ABW190_14390 [Rhizobacter sp.]